MPQYVAQPDGHRATLVNWVAVYIRYKGSQAAPLHLIGTARDHDRLGNGIIITSPVTKLLRLPSGRLMGAITGSSGRTYRLVGDCSDFKLEHLKMLLQALHAWGVDQKDTEVLDDAALARIDGAVLEI